MIRYFKICPACFNHTEATKNSNDLTCCNNCGDEFMAPNDSERVSLKPEEYTVFTLLIADINGIKDKGFNKVIKMGQGIKSLADQARHLAQNDVVVGFNGMYPAVRDKDWEQAVKLLRKSKWKRLYP